MNYFRKMKNKKGFTLIELLIVIAILAILALLGLPRLAAFRSDASAREVISTGETIGRAAEAFVASTTVTIVNTAGAHDVAIQDYLDPSSATRLGAASAGDYDVTVDSNLDITVAYLGTMIDSTAIGTVGPGEDVYPEFSTTDAADAD